MIDTNSTFYIAKTSPGCHSLSLDCQEFRELFLREINFNKSTILQDASIIMIGACVVSSAMNEEQTIELVKKMKVHKDLGALIIVSGCLTDHLRSRISSLIDCLYFSVAEIEKAKEYFGFSNAPDKKKMAVDIKSVESMNEMVKRWQILHGVFV